MNKDDSFRMNRALEQMIHHANEALYFANNCGDEAVVKRVQEVLGNVVVELDFKLLEPLYKEFPELKPAALRNL